MKLLNGILFFSVTGMILTGHANAAAITSKPVDADLAKIDVDGAYWSGAPSEKIDLMAQPMVPPRPKTTNTSSLSVQSVHNGKWIAFRLKWKDSEKSEAGRLGEFSDAIAIQFPVKSNETPPPVFMGTSGDPVYLLHWRAQYQRDKEKGKPGMRDLYKNMSVDMYPMEFADHGKLGAFSEESRDTFSPGRSSGNPQSYSKTGVDEIMAEGFSTSSIMEGHAALATGRWENGEWTVVITRPLAREGASVLTAGKGSFVGFAIWQGGHQEVGSRKSVTMVWTPLAITK